MPRQIAAPRTHTPDEISKELIGLPAAVVRRSPISRRTASGRQGVALPKSPRKTNAGGAQHNSAPDARATMEAKGSEDEAKDSKEEEPPSKVVIDLLNFAMKVVHEEMSGF